MYFHLWWTFESVAKFSYSSPYSFWGFFAKAFSRFTENKITHNFSQNCLVFFFNIKNLYPSEMNSIGVVYTAEYMCNLCTMILK